MKSNVRSRWWDPLLAGIPDVSAEALGLYRIVFASLLAWAVATRTLPRNPFPREMHNHVPGVADWAVFHWLAGRPDLVARLEDLLLVALGLFAIGFFTRLSLLVVAAATTVWIVIRLHHSGVHDWAIVVPAVIGIVPTAWGDGFSVDEMIRRWRGRGREGRHGRSYGFGIWLPGLVVGLGFAGAAAAKLRESGFAWILGGAVKYHFVTDARNAPVRWGLWVASHHWVAVMMSFFAVWLEGTIIVGSLARRQLWRFLFGMGAFLVLAGFYLFQNEVWLAWWIVATSFLPWNGIFAAVASCLPSEVALVDSRCPLCRRTARLLHGLDWFNRIEFVDANDPGVRRRLAAGIPADGLLRDMHALSRRGELTRGYRAYLALARAMPVMWPLLAIGLLPPIVWGGERIYQRIAASRRRDESCSDDTCAIHGSVPATTGLSAALPPSASVSPHSAAALRPAQLAIIAIVCVLQLMASALRREIEPWMSDYPMYAHTYSSIEEFNKKNPVKRVHHFRREALDGAPEDISKTLDDIPEGDVVIIQAVDELVQRGALSPELQQKVRAVSREFQRQMGRPLARVTLLVSEEAFDWRRGRFSWKTVGARVGTVDTETLRLAASDIGH